MDRDPVVQIDGPEPLPVVAGVKTVDPGQASRAPGAPIDAVEKTGRRNDGAELGGLGIAFVPVKGVGVSDTLTKMPDRVLAGRLVEQADAVLTGPVETAQPLPQSGDAFGGYLS